MKNLVSVLLCAALLILSICHPLSAFVSAAPSALPTSNLITDSDFETYTAGTLLGDKANTSLLWQTNNNAKTWFNAKVTDQGAHSGTKSLALNSRYNTAYRPVDRLTINTDYVFSFYYYLPVQTTADNVTFGFSAVSPTSATLSNDGSLITPSLVKAATNLAGGGQWLKQVVTFNSGSNTSVNLYFNFISTDSTGGPASKLLIDDIMLYPLSDVLPSFIPNSGGVTCDYGLQDGDTISYHASLLKGNTFGGWYLNGVRSESSETLKISQYQAASYTLSAVDNNLIDDGAFEGYPNGTNLRLPSDNTKWLFATSDGSDWPTATVDSRESCIGKNSLSLYSFGAAAYRKVEGLKKNSIYSLSFDYYLPAYTSINLAALNFVSVVPGTTASVSSTGNDTTDAIQLTKCSGAAYQGSGSWKNFNFIFDSGDNTSVYLALGYNATVSAAVSLNIDDLSLCEYHGTPIIPNGDFEQNNVRQWSKSDSVSFTTTPNSNAPAELGNYCGKIKTTLDYKEVFSPTIQLDGGCSFEVSMWLKFDSTYPATQTQANGTITDAYADFGLMAGKVDTTYQSSSSMPLNIKRYDENGNLLANYTNTNQNGSRTAVSPTSYSGAAYGKWNKFVFTFTAPSYSTASFGVRLNSKGIVYIDGFTVKKLTTSTTDEVKHSVTRVGNAIRLEGPQGIRYKNRIDKNALAAGFEGYRIVEYGAVAIKKIYLDSSELLLGGTYAYNGQIKKAASGVAYREDALNPIDIRAGETKTTIDFSVVLIGISPSDYLTNYVLRPYLILQNDAGAKTTVYCDMQVSSIFLVAELAYNAKNPDQTFTETADTRSYLYSDILTKANYIDLSVANDNAPLSTTFKGMSTTVYHCYTFMNDQYGRNYTDQMAATEMDRLKDCGITTVRSIFKSQFAWSDDQNGWDWKSTNMQAVYKWAKMLQNRGIDIAFNAGWQMNYYTDQSASIPEVPYLFGNGDDLYGESSGVDFTGMSDYDIRFKKASLRYAEWMKQAVEALTANGVYNVKYLLVFTEPSTSRTGTPEGFDAFEWCEMATALHQSLVKAGIRQQYQLVGPNQGSTPSGEGLLNYALAHLSPDVIDIYTTHYYPKPAYIKDDVFGTLYGGAYASYRTVMDRYGCTKDLWADETYASSTVDSVLGTDSAWSGTQTAVGLAESMKYGLEAMVSWQFTDQLWPNQTGSGGSFLNGFNISGMAPSLLNSNVPKAQYYATGLTSKYFGVGNGSIYSCNAPDGSGLYISCAKLADGNWTIMVVNAGQNPTTFRTTLGSAINATLNRHLFDHASVGPTSEAKLAGIDATFHITNTLCDTIPSGGVAIYTTRAD